MGRPPSNGGPVFRFTASEVMEMEAILQEHNNAMPAREVLVALAEKFSESADRKGKIVVQMKQVWNWFQNKRYAIRAKSSKSPAKLNISPMTREESTPVRNASQPISVPMPSPVPGTVSVPAPSPPAPVHVTPVPSAGKGASDNCYMEFEAKSARDGAWYDVASFLSHRYLEGGDPEVLVRFAGFGAEEDEWVNVRRHVRQRSLPCESSECVAVLPGDLILCFQEGKEQALYFDAHVLDAQRRRHDVRGCRCRFLVRYDHDQTEEIVPLRKICRRPETDYRLQQLHALDQSAAAAQQKASTNPSVMSAPNVSSNPAETMQSRHNADTARVVPAINANTSGVIDGQKDLTKSDVIEQITSGTSSAAMSVVVKSEVTEQKASGTIGAANAEKPDVPAGDGVLKGETTMASVGLGGNMQQGQN